MIINNYDNGLDLCEVAINIRVFFHTVGWRNKVNAINSNSNYKNLLKNEKSGCQYLYYLKIYILLKIYIF